MRARDLPAQGRIDRAALLLATSSAGLAVPFLRAAIAPGSAPRVIRSVNSRLRHLTGSNGGMTLAMRAFMALGIFQRFFSRELVLSPWGPWEPTV